MQKDYSSEQLHKQAIEYLLGQLSEREESKFEAAYFEDFAVYEQIQAIEEDLIEDYLRGRLAEDQSARFEEHYMALPGRRERVDFAKALLLSLPPATAASLPVTESSDSWVRPFRGLAAFYPKTLAGALSIVAILALAGVSIWLAIETRRLRGQLAVAEQKRVELERVNEGIQQQLEKERADNESLSKVLQQERDHAQQLEGQETQAAKPGASVVSFVLPRLSTRGHGQPQAIRIGRETAWIDLKLNLGESAFGAYMAVVRHLGGGVVLSKRGSSSTSLSGKFFTVKLPAQSMEAGDYVITIEGVTERNETSYIGEYSFTIIR